MQLPGGWDYAKFIKDHGLGEGSPVIVACYIVLNEADYIFHSISSIYPVVDKIIIVEGATQYAVKDVVSPVGLSTDGTPQLIQAFIDHVDLEGKVKWVRAGWVSSKTDLRNRCLEHLPPNTSFILRIDGDELFMAEDLKNAIKEMLKTNALVAQARHLMFWGSTELLLESVPDPDYVDVLYRYSPTMFYRDHMELMLDPNHPYREDPTRIIRPEGFRLFHMGHVKDVRKIILKRWERLRQLQIEAQHIPHFQYLKQKDDYRLYVEAISHCKAFNLANIDTRCESVMPYSGPWPESLISHMHHKMPPSFFGFD